MVLLSLHHRTFTLAELLVLVVTILAVLVGLLLPAVHKVRQAVARTQSAEHLRRIGLGFNGHHDARGVLPHGVSGSYLSDREEWTWAYQILPYLGEKTVFDAKVCIVDATPIAILRIPARQSATLYAGKAKIDYAGNAGTGNNGVLVEGPIAYLRFRDITDGTAQTVMVGEKQLNPLMFGKSRDDDDPYARAEWKDFEVHRLGSVQPARDEPVEGDPTPSRAFGSPLVSGFNRLFADGAVRHIRYAVDLLIWQRACVRNDGEGLSLNEL